MGRIIGIFLVFIVSGCAQSAKKTQSIESVYKGLSKGNYESFRNWHISKRYGEDIYIIDYDTKDSIVRFLVKEDQGNYLICKNNPGKKNLYTPLDTAFAKTLKAVGITQNELSRNVQIYFQEGVERITYAPTFDGVIIEKGNLIFINLLSLKALKKVPNSYKAINNSWYYFVN